MVSIKHHRLEPEKLDLQEGGVSPSKKAPLSLEDKISLSSCPPSLLLQEKGVPFDRDSKSLYSVPVLSHTFSKRERLYLRHQLETLFAHPSGSLFVFPFRVLVAWEVAQEPAAAGAAVVISVSKRSFKRAVDRNRIKRLTREAYRLQKEQLVKYSKEHAIRVRVAFIFVGKELPAFRVVHRVVGKIIGKVMTHLDGQRIITSSVDEVTTTPNRG